MSYHLREREDGRYDVIDGLIEGQGRVINTIDSLDIADDSNSYAQDTQGDMNMPWELVDRGGQTCVRKKGESQPLKCYDDRADAEAYMRALYANVKESGNMGDHGMAADAVQMFADEGAGGGEEDLQKIVDQYKANPVGKITQALAKLDKFFQGLGVRWSADNQLGNWMDLHSASCRVGGWNWHPHEQAQAQMILPNILGQKYAVGTSANMNLVKALSGYRWNVGDDPVMSLAQHLSDWGITGQRPPNKNDLLRDIQNPGGQTPGGGSPPKYPGPPSGGGGIPIPAPKDLLPDVDLNGLLNGIEEDPPTALAVSILVGWQWGLPLGDGTPMNSMDSTGR